MITLQQLEYITALDTTRHFASAAEKCFVSQPTLSMQIKKLENDLGVVIFDRSKQPVMPTDTGIKVIAQARIVLQEAGRIDQIVRDERGEVSGELRIGIIPTVSPYVLPLFAGDLIRSYPGIRLKFEEAVTEQIEEMLVHDELDAGIVVTPLHNRQVLEYPVFYEEIMVYHHPGHSFSEQPGIPAEKIDKEGLWLLGEGHCFRSQAVNLCELSKVASEDMPYEFEGGSLSTLMKVIDREGGYTLIPELAVSMDTDPLLIKRFEGKKPLREVSLVYTRKFAKTRLIELLAEAIRNSVPAHLPDRDRGYLVEWR